MQDYLSNPTNRHEPDLAKEIIAAITKKAVARVRRREVTPLRRAAELAVLYIEDGTPITAKDRLKRTIKAVEQIQKGGRHGR